nr:hypothetical protein [uncultured Rhodopila sp.]
MVTLEGILEEARNDPFLQNTTILTTDQFYTIRGPSSPAFRARLEAAIAGAGDLAKVQQLNADEGLEIIEPVRAGTRGGCWYLRNLTHRGETYPAGEGRFNSIVEALQAAIEWWQAETWCRGVMVRAFEVRQANGQQ